MLTPLAALAIGCGGTRRSQSAPAPIPVRSPPSPIPGLRADQRPVKTGRGPRYRLSAISAAVASRARIGGLRCRRAHPSGYGVHLELFADHLVLPVPAGIGVAPPQRRRGVYVLSGACTYPVRTFEPTGVLVLDAGAPRTLSVLFAIWGQGLSSDRLAGFRGPVVAFVNGRRWPSSPSAIKLARHAEIVLEVGGILPPHPRYRFPPGL